MYYLFNCYKWAKSKSECTILLPPASEGWGKVLFSVCLSVHTSTGGGGGTPSQVWVRGYPFPDLGIPSQVWMGGYPIPGLDGGGGGEYPGYLSPPIRQSSIASNCYVAGSMPPAFKQTFFVTFGLYVFDYCHFFRLT